MLPSRKLWMFLGVNSEALKKVVREKSDDRVVFVITYNPRLSRIIGKHWRSMVNAWNISQTTTGGLQTSEEHQGYSDQINDARVRSSETQANKCGNCRTCQFVQTGKTVRAKATTEVIDINTKVSCKDSNVIYLIDCSHCGEQYVGETEKSLHTRFSQHTTYVKNKAIFKATGFHFNQRGHSIRHESDDSWENLQSRPKL